MIGLATTVSIARDLFNGDMPRAERALTELTVRGRLRRQVFHAQTGSLVYFTPEKDRLNRSVLYRRFAVLAYTSLQPRRRPFLDATEYRDTVGAIARNAGLNEPPWQPCYLHRASASESPRLSAVRVGTTRSLQAAIADLERWVSSPSFKTWWYFAAVDGFVLTYLHRGPRAAADELGRWLRRRPLLSRLGENPTPVPVFVYETRTPPEFVTAGACSKKDNTPAGVLSRSHRPESA